MKSIYKILLNKKMKITIQGMELRMWESTTMPEAMKGADGKLVKDEKGKIVNTGKTLEYTTYTFRDMLGEVIKVMSSKNNYREFENKSGDLILNLTRKEFQGKAETKVTFVDFLPKKV